MLCPSVLAQVLMDVHRTHRAVSQVAVLVELTSKWRVWQELAGICPGLGVLALHGISQFSVCVMDFSACVTQFGGFVGGFF